MQPTGRALWSHVVRSELSLVGRVFAPFARLFRRVRRVSELFPWTALGVLVTALAYAALEWLAYEELDLVWLVVGYVGLGLTLLAPVLVLVAAVWLRVSSRSEPRLTTHPIVLETGTWQETSFERPALRFLPLVQVRWEWLEPRGAEVETVQRGSVLHERVRLPERGFHERVVRRLVVSDAFGLSRVRFRVQRVQPVEVRPRLGALRALPALTALASGDALPHPMGLSEGDRLELRRYAAGDPARFIHWKVWSRTGKMMVRMPERALSVARRMAAFAIAGDEDDASIAAARLSIDQRALGQDWVLGTDGEPGGVTRADLALDALVSSVEHKAHAGSGLRAFVERVEQGGPASYVLFVPPQRGAWIGAVGQVARGRALRVVIGVDGVRGKVVQPLWRRALMRPEQAQGVDAVELERLVAELSALGASVALLDRVSGRALSAAHLHASVRSSAARKEAPLRAQAVRP
jgi:hypothetical protein